MEITKNTKYKNTKKDTFEKSEGQSQKCILCSHSSAALALRYLGGYHRQVNNKKKNEKMRFE